jgi:hypothetical protein
VIRFVATTGDGGKYGCEGDFGKEICCAAERRGTRTACSTASERKEPRRELALESALAKLDKYHLLILDDIVYLSKDQAETSL